ncbi:hypothetical protein NE237_029025 [Protea cynaroides]|uniref:Uncharacterized protein n=1 Tax=Protea cynaroides TaxID=273540 RepID=A0A9Q0GT59_9MAGN|nr:hypothetical protein NE237_029025 [Protea cynaroides]
MVFSVRGSGSVAKGDLVMQSGQKLERGAREVQEMSGVDRDYVGSGIIIGALLVENQRNLSWVCNPARVSLQARKDSRGVSDRETGLVNPLFLEVPVRIAEVAVMIAGRWSDCTR